MHKAGPGQHCRDLRTEGDGNGSNWSESWHLEFATHSGSGCLPFEVFRSLSFPSAFVCAGVLYTWIPPFACADSVGLESENKLSERELFEDYWPAIGRMDGFKLWTGLKSPCTV